MQVVDKLQWKRHLGVRRAEMQKDYVKLLQIILRD